MFSPSDLSGVSEDLARRVIAVARSIAPCLDSLTGESKNEAVAILKAIAAEGAGRGSRLIRSQRIGPAGVDYADAGSWFSDDDRGALRAMCADFGSSRVPVGQFPKPSTAVSRMWPEEQVQIP